MSAPIVDAVTALLVHDGELFLTLRHPALQAFPGYHAFPGGKVDPDDALTTLPDHPLLAPYERRFMAGLIRELKEELDFDLIAALERGQVEDLRLYGRVVTPSHVPRRFDTQFFVIALTERPEFTLESREATAGFWVAPAVWLREYEQGQILLAPPTLHCIRALAQHGPNTQASFDFAPPEGQLLHYASVWGVEQIAVRSNTLPPAEHTNCFVIGDAPGQRIALDPSPRDTKELDKLCATLSAMEVSALLITHHHPDHYQHADAIARRYGWPLLMSATTERRIRAIRGDAWFDGLTVRNVRDGDTVTHWRDLPVEVVEVPGHDDGQIALMPADRAWCIVGDLIQGVGTVVIAKPEGNMQQYFASLQRIIDLAPRAILPSHGIALGTTFRLEETLRHRRMREQQVLTLHQSGRRLEQMLEALYPDVDARLLPLARMNIESHLEKLEAEGLLG
jgi:glyoxylase-like metal-dependent hydrolase (beta-lactamase superfamily II)/8-oxo-dGTP pyrophosphatase MutT (NUDIX family)